MNCCGNAGWVLNLTGQIACGECGSPAEWNSFTEGYVPPSISYTPKTPVCDCGRAKGGGTHSSWCSIAVANK